MVPPGNKTKRLSLVFREDKLKAQPAITWILEKTYFGAETDPIDLIFFITDGKVLMNGSFRFLEVPCGCWKAPLSGYIFSVSEQLFYLITAYLHNLPPSSSNFTIVRFKICSFKVLRRTYDTDVLIYVRQIFQCCWFHLSYRFSHFLYLCK